MTSRQPFSRSKRLGQDSQERHALDQYNTTDNNRPTVSITGNGTSEEIGVNIPIGQVSNPTSGQDIEVIVGAHGEDPHNKLGSLTQPEATRYKAKTGEHGIQSPEDSSETFLFTPSGQTLNGKNSLTITNDKDVRANTQTVGSVNGAEAASLVSGGASIEVRNGTVYISGPIVCTVMPVVGNVPKPM